MRSMFLFAVLMIISSSFLTGQEVTQVFLYEDRQSENDPCIFVRLNESEEVKPAVLIFPGGGYRVLSMKHEGENVANWFLERGIHAIVLRYSLGMFDGSGEKHPAMINDAKRAMRLIRKNAKKWGIDPNKIAVMGFSAGGHLASTLSTHADSGNPIADDMVEIENCVPNLCILAYPVIMMEGINTHWGSRRFLLGPTPRIEDIHELSNEKHVNTSTPPTFLFHTSDDHSVPVQNSINYYLALREYGIPAEMHIFEHGEHGVGLEVDDFALGQWEGLLENWLVRWNWVEGSH